MPFTCWLLHHNIPIHSRTPELSGATSNGESTAAAAVLKRKRAERLVGKETVQEIKRPGVG